MTDPIRFQVDWKSSSLYSTSANSSSISDLKTLTIDDRSRPSQPERPFQPFDSEIEDEIDYEELCILLSRQFLNEVDASITLSPNSDIATIPETSYDKTWSPSLCPLLSPPLSQIHKDALDYSSDSTSSSTAVWWFGPYGNNSEFDPTLQQPGCFTTATAMPDTTMMSLPHEDDDTTSSYSQHQSPKKRQVCRHYLAGECYRKHCWFAHDLDVKLCKFWLQGSCLKGDTCEFAHRLKEQNDDHHDSSSIIDTTQRFQEPQYPTMADFTISVAKSSRKSKRSRNKKVV